MFFGTLLCLWIWFKSIKNWRRYSTKTAIMGKLVIAMYRLRPIQQWTICQYRSVVTAYASITIASLSTAVVNPHCVTPCRPLWGRYWLNCFGCLATLHYICLYRIAAVGWIARVLGTLQTSLIAVYVTIRWSFYAVVFVFNSSASTLAHAVSVYVDFTVSAFIVSIFIRSQHAASFKF